MVTLPKGFTATRFPGYFWDVNEQKLYSIKIDGVLKEISKVYPMPRNYMPEPGYRVSVKGRQRAMRLSYLKSLTQSQRSLLRRAAKSLILL